jgi:hypothetical protein
VEGSTYVLDANVFIEASRRYYAFDLAPVFWNKLVQLPETGTVESIDWVRKELEKGKGKKKEEDEIVRWISAHFSHAFRSADEADILDAFGQVMTWVQNQRQYTDAAKADFASGADGWLIAYAVVKGRTLVTHEKQDPSIRRKVLIPNACEPFHIRFVDTFMMLRELGVRFT